VQLLVRLVAHEVTPLASSPRPQRLVDQDRHGRQSGTGARCPPADGPIGSTLAQWSGEPRSRAPNRVAGPRVR
jgi:hypothetical protein